MSEIFIERFPGDELGEGFWELHPEHPDRVALRNWIDNLYAVAAEAVVHRHMQVVYDQVIESEDGAAAELEVAALHDVIEVAGEIAASAVVVSNGQGLQALRNKVATAA
jgi:uncharacterized protein